MVFFSCNVCGEALKKNQVDKHCMTKCRSCESVSCIDCGKDFWGNEYENHTKCISEDQKYSGKNFVAKVNKGEAKQDRWIEQVQIAIDKNKNNTCLRGPLESIKNYPNIPRKKNKFENFLQNSLRIRDRNLISQLWGVIMEEAAKNVKPPSDSTPDTTSDSTPGNTNLTNGEDNVENTQAENCVTENNYKVEKKLSKQERKEERRKRMNKKEKKDKASETVDSVKSIEKDIKRSKRKKKRKHAEMEEEEMVSNGKKRKIEEEEMVDDMEEEKEEEPPKKKSKFNWEKVITEVLSSKGEISVKKLKKKVLLEYMSQMGEPRSEEKLWMKFDKKLLKNPNFRVLKERVKLTAQA